MLVPARHTHFGVPDFQLTAFEQLKNALQTGASEHVNAICALDEKEFE
jgi:fructose/tagatose bisphosphate aldolase